MDWLSGGKSCEQVMVLFAAVLDDVLKGFQQPSFSAESLRTMETAGRA